MSDPAAKYLAKRIEDLEHQRELLLSELSSKATASLDPRSELSNLLTQLQSSDKAVRSKAVEGLVVLKNPLSFPALVNFLVSHPDEATSGDNPFIIRWFSVLIETGGQKGAEFVVSQIEGSNPGWSEAAFSTVQYALDTPELIDGAMPSLESAALRHSSTAARTKCKLLIQSLSAKKKEYVERQKEREERERYRAELDADRQAEGNQIPSDFIIVSALKGNGLDSLARDMIRGGGDLRFWKSGLLIAEEFASNLEHRDGCMRAIKQILKTADTMVKPSRALLLFLLSGMKPEAGDTKAATSYLAEAKELSPATIDFFSQNGNSFGVQGKVN